MTEYDFENIELPEDTRKLVDMGMANIDAINPKIKELINKRAKDGWEPLYPFSVPMVWFRREKRSKKK